MRSVCFVDLMWKAWFLPFSTVHFLLPTGSNIYLVWNYQVVLRVFLILQDGLEIQVAKHIWISSFLLPGECGIDWIISCMKERSYSLNNLMYMLYLCKSNSRRLEIKRKNWANCTIIGILNVDGAIFEGQHSIGVGMVLRDVKGDVIMIATRKEYEVNDPIEIELLAVFRGLQICMHMGITNLIVESDSLLMVQAIQSGKCSLSLLGNLSKESIGLMQCFVLFHLVHRKVGECSGS